MSDKNKDQEKTEEPTARKLEKAREEGNVSISKEVSSVMLMTSAIVMLLYSGGFMYRRIEAMMETFFSNAGVPIDNDEQAINYLEMALRFGFEMIIPLMIILLVTALLVNILQTGGVFATKAMKPKASKISPASGFKRVFSMKGFMELVKGFSKLFIVGMIIVFTVRADVDHFLTFSIMPMGSMLSEAGSYVLMFVSRILAALFVLSIIDAVFQRFQHHKELRMTKQEVKDEYKQMEGDPHIKSKRRKAAMTMRMQKRLDHSVLNSDVVVTNPTHYAVALRYNPDANEAPVVMAKGQRKRALRIKELAKHYGIPIVENKPVAQALFATAEEDEYIPEGMYRAVAEILAYVYKLKNKKY
ncbi:flagellar biosynthesis protein FlhB [Balneolaceae bacterium ANBcel3]|nr:flagellar biosynthesis protein FlhB [Balneolaceae bacterium ANBcel3]